MGDQDTETVDCPTCEGHGVLKRFESPVVCSTCDGEGKFTRDDLDRQLGRMAEAIANLPGAGADLDPDAVALARYEAADEKTPGAGADAEARLLTERGIKGRPGVERRHLLPHEGGEVSNRLMVLVLAAGLSGPPRRPTTTRIVGSSDSRSASLVSS